MNRFLQSLEITFRRDPTNFRPRVNKLYSVKDKEQKSLYLVDVLRSSSDSDGFFFSFWKLFLPRRMKAFWPLRSRRMYDGLGCTTLDGLLTPYLVVGRSFSDLCVAI